MGGAKNVRRYLEHYGPHGLDLTLAGLCDAREEDDFRHALAWAGVGSDLDRPTMEAVGFYVCVADLEAELIRALGPVEVERVIEAEGELGSFRTFQQQPAQQGCPHEAQLRRFMGTKGGRKIRCAPCWSPPSTWPTCPGRWTASSPTSEAARRVGTPPPGGSGEPHRRLDWIVAGRRPLHWRHARSRGARDVGWRTRRTRRCWTRWR